MATIGSASVGSPDFPVERMVAALARLAGVLLAFWGVLMAAMGFMIGLPIVLTIAAEADDAASSFAYAAAAPFIAGLGNGLVIAIGGIILFAAGKRVARFVTKDL